jgi:hypothetical protein
VPGQIPLPYEAGEQDFFIARLPKQPTSIRNHVKRLSA